MYLIEKIRLRECAMSSGGALIIDREQFLNQFRIVIDNYLDSNQNRNILNLARESMVSESSLRKAYNKQCVLRPDTLIKVLRVVANKENIYDLLNYHNGYFKTYLKSFVFYEDQKDKKVTMLSNDHVSDFQKYLIIKRVFHRDVVKREDIKLLFGHSGLKKLDELIHEEIIGEKEGILSVNLDQDGFVLPIENCANHLGELIKTFFKPSNALNNKSIIRSISNTVDEESYKKIMSILKDATNEIIKISSTSGPGNIPFVFCGMVEKFNFDEVKDEE